MRRTMRKSRINENTLVYLKTFFVLLGLLISVSFVAQGVSLVHKSTFGGHSFTLLVITRTPFIAHVDKKTKQLATLSLQGGEKLRGKHRLEESILLRIPIDGIITYKSGFSNVAPSSFFSLKNIATIVSNPHAYQFDNLNSLDLFKLYLAAKIASNQKSVEIKLEEGSTDETDRTLSLFFKDSVIINEKVSIEIVNATHTLGLGGKVAMMLKNASFNVISVSSADEIAASRVIYRVEKTETVRKLSRIFDVPAEYKNETSVADVSIIIGKDLGENLRIE